MLLSTNQTTTQTITSNKVSCGFGRRLLIAVGMLTMTICFAPALHAAEPVLQAAALDPKVYDLNSRHGVLAVYERVQTIAEQHCVASSDLAQPLTAKERACRDRILTQLLVKLADPYLSYLHANPEAQRISQAVAP